MGILEKLSTINESEESKNVARMKYIKKILNLKESQKICEAADSTIQKAIEMNGYPMVVAMEQYMTMCEGTEKERIKKIFKMLKVKGY